MIIVVSDRCKPVYRSKVQMDLAETKLTNHKISFLSRQTKLSVRSTRCFDDTATVFSPVRQAKAIVAFTLVSAKAEFSFADIHTTWDTFLQS